MEGQWHCVDQKRNEVISVTIISNGGEHQAPHRKRMWIAGAAAGVLILAAVLAGTAEREEEAIVPEPVKVSMNGPSVIVAQEPVEEPEEPWYTEQELEWLAITIYKEAGGDACGDETRIKVANVVLNRMASEKFPDTMYEVLTAPRQFNTFYLEGIEWPERASYETGAVERAYECARRVLDGERLLDEDVVWMAEFPQGSEIVEYVDGLYFCRG